MYSTIFPLSDVLQLDIDIYTDGLENFELKGSRNWTLPILQNDFKFKIKIETSNVGENYAGVLLSISKDFWIYAYFDNSIDVKGTITVLYLDIKGIKPKELIQQVLYKDLDSAIDYLNPLIKAEYSKSVDSILWNEIKISETL